MRTTRRCWPTASATAWIKEAIVLSWTRCALACVACALLGPAWGQTIYTCVDAKGRRLTADRPIVECLDREQRELNSSGTVRRRIGPVLTAEERAVEEEKARKLADERSRLEEEKKRDRALLLRYPTKAVHDKERLLALASVGDVIAAANKRVGELADQRKHLDAETEFYKSAPSKLPVKLKRQIEENEQQQAAQKRFLGGQDSERARINARFDEELGKLTQLWATHATLSAPAAPAAGASRSAGTKQN